MKLDWSNGRPQDAVTMCDHCNAHDLPTLFRYCPWCGEEL